MFDNIAGIPVCKNFKWAGIAAIVISAAAVIALVLAPFGAGLFNFDIDFAGGTTFHYALHTPATREVQDDVREMVEDATGVSVSSVQSTGDDTEVIIKTLEMDSVNREKVFTALVEKYGLTDDDRLAVDNVSAAVGKDMQNMAVSASLLAVLLILIYIAIRFDLRSGIAAVVSLVFAILSMVSAYVIFQIPMNVNFIAAMLTILGYSINATIVVFDRIRENNRRRGKESFESVVDLSVRQTMGRSINTTVTTLLMVTMLIIFGVQSIRLFALSLLVGIIFGAFASIFIAGPVWAWLLKKFPKRA